MPIITLETAILQIVPDSHPENPRDWDTLGTMVCWHRRYALGDRHDFPDPQAFARAITPRTAVILPLYLFDHSGLTISTDPTPFRACDPAGWDWGQVGYIYARHHDIRTVYGVQRLSRTLREHVAAGLRAEVAVYDQYLRGEVYGFILTDRATGEQLDACWGFYGPDILANGMLAHLSTDLQDALRAHLYHHAA